MGTMKIGGYVQTIECRGVCSRGARTVITDHLEIRIVVGGARRIGMKCCGCGHVRLNNFNDPTEPGSQDDAKRYSWQHHAVRAG